MSHTLTRLLIATIAVLLLCESAADAQTTRIHQLEREIMLLRRDILRLREDATLIAHQLHTLEATILHQEGELRALRPRVVETHNQWQERQREVDVVARQLREAQGRIDAAQSSLRRTQRDIERELLDSTALLQARERHEHAEQLKRAARDSIITQLRDEDPRHQEAAQMVASEQAKLRALQDDDDTPRERIAAAAHDLLLAQNRVSDIEQAALGEDDRYQRLVLAHEEAARALADLRQTLPMLVATSDEVVEAGEQVQQQRQAAAPVQAEHREKSARAGDARRLYESVITDVRELEHRIAANRTQIASLQRSLSNRQTGIASREYQLSLRLVQLHRERRRAAAAAGD